MKDTFDSELDEYLTEEKEYQCRLCDTTIEEDGYCSRECFNVDLR